MSPDQINKAISKWCGPPQWHYCYDRADMAAAVKLLPNSKKEEYVQHLVRVARAAQKGPSPAMLSDYMVVEAPPIQRAEALLKTLKRWRG